MPNAIQGKMIVKKEDKPKVCMFCDEDIDEKKANFLWVEHYDKGKLAIARWCHLDCHGQFYEKKVLERIQSKMIQIMPQFKSVIQNMGVMT